MYVYVFANSHAFFRVLSREGMLFLTREQTNTRAQVLSIMQLLVMVALTCANISYLHYYFTSKKVV
jgi:hypothetical protein